jgi:hypothetical protein
VAALLGFTIPIDLFQLVHQGFYDWPARHLPYAEDRCHDLGDQRRVRERRVRDEPDAVGMLWEQVSGTLREDIAGDAPGDAWWTPLRYTGHECTRAWRDARSPGCIQE